MTMLITIAFLLAVTGSFILLSLSPFTFFEGLADYVRPQKTSMKSKIRKSRKNKQPKGLKLLFLETREILRVTGKSGMFTALCILSMGKMAHPERTGLYYHHRCQQLFREQQ